MKHSQQLVSGLFVLTLATSLVTGCDRKKDEQSPVDEGTVSTGDVTLQSASYGAAGLLLTAANITDFKFCVTKIEMEDESGGAVEDEGSSSIEADLGLIDLSDPASTTAWGTISIPVDFTLSALKIEVHKDAEKCAGADYSVSFQGKTLSRDLEFEFEFNPPVPIVAGDTLTLAIDNIATALSDADAASKFDDEQVSEYLNETAKGSGDKED